jgi:hypothetical protein
MEGWNEKHWNEVEAIDQVYATMKTKYPSPTKKEIEEGRDLLELCANQALHRRRWGAIFRAIFVVYVWVGLVYYYRDVLDLAIIILSLPFTLLFALWMFFHHNNSFKRLIILTRVQLYKMEARSLARGEFLERFLVRKQRYHLGLETKEEEECSAGTEKSSRKITNSVAPNAVSR